MFSRSVDVPEPETHPAILGAKPMSERRAPLIGKARGAAFFRRVHGGVIIESIMICVAL